MGQSSRRSWIWTVLGGVAGFVLLAAAGGYVAVLNFPRFQPDGMLLDSFVEQAQARPITWSKGSGGMHTFPLISFEEQELQRRGGKRLMNVLPLLGHEDADVVVEVFRMRDTQHLSPTDPRWEPWVKKVRKEELLSHPDRRVRWMALDMLVKKGRMISVEQVKTTLNDPEPEVRRMMSRRLGLVLSRHFTNAAYRRALTLMLIEHLDHKSQAVREEAYDTAFRSLVQAAPENSELARRIANDIMKKDGTLELEEGRAMQKRLRELIEKHGDELDFSRT